MLYAFLPLAFVVFFITFLMGAPTTMTTLRFVFYGKWKEIVYYNFLFHLLYYYMSKLNYDSLFINH